MKSTGLKLITDHTSEPDVADASCAAAVSSLCVHRDPEDDFFCLRYRVWYGSLDCAIRTRYRTAPGCRNCEQGRFNLKRHSAALARQKRPFRPVGLG